jgi:nitroreductase
LADALLPGNPAATAVRTASAVLLLIGVPKEGAFHQGKDYWLVDCGIAGEHIFLQATELGIGTVWVSALDGGRVCEAAELPEGMQCVGLFPLGYPLGDFQAKPRVGRRPFSEVVYLERYGQAFASEEAGGGELDED